MNLDAEIAAWEAEEAAKRAAEFDRNAAALRAKMAAEPMDWDAAAAEQPEDDEDEDEI